jgi:D-hexose-6-phosphate mutarotase
LVLDEAAFRLVSDEVLKTAGQGQPQHWANGATLLATQQCACCVPTVQVVDKGSGATVEINKTGFPDAVVWNPWIEKAKAMGDFGDEEYKVNDCLSRCPEVLLRGSNGQSAALHGIIHCLLAVQEMSMVSVGKAELFTCNIFII